MANICNVCFMLETLSEEASKEIYEEMISRRQSGYTVDTLGGCFQIDALYLGAPERLVYASHMEMQDKAVRIYGEVRWGFKEHEVAQVFTHLFDQFGELEHIELLWVECGMPTCGKATCTRGNDDIDEIYLPSEYMAGGINAIAFCHDEGFISDADWSKTEYDFCVKQLEDEVFTETNAYSLDPNKHFLKEPDK